MLQQSGTGKVPLMSAIASQVHGCSLPEETACLLPNLEPCFKDDGGDVVPTVSFFSLYFE